MYDIIHVVEKKNQTSKRNEKKTKTWRMGEMLRAETFWTEKKKYLQRA